MIRALLAGVLGLACACVNVHRDVRVDRGPVLRSWEREIPIQGGGTVGAVDVQWPQVTLKFHSFELCRQERVEEVVEERVTEAFAPSAGPAFAMGVTGTAIGGGLFAFRGAFSDQPNLRYIDETGRFGPSPRQVATSWSYVLLAVGVPALVTGIVGMVQQGESVEQRKVEQVASAMETQCHLLPADGEVELVRARGQGPEAIRVPTQGGAVTLWAGQLAELRLASVHMNGQRVLLPEEEAQELGAFFACTEILPVPSEEGLARLTEQQLVARYNTARQCELVGGQAGVDAVKAYSGEIQRRRAGGPPPAFPAGPVPLSYSDALEAYRPTLRLAPESEDLQKLSSPEALRDQAATVHGTLTRRLEDGRLLLDVGGRGLIATRPEGAAWADDFEVGSPVSAVGVIVGEETLGPERLAVIQAAWAQRFR